MSGWTKDGEDTRPTRVLITHQVCASVCVCVCVCVRERERESVCVCDCVSMCACACVSERVRVGNRLKRSVYGRVCASECEIGCVSVSDCAASGGVRVSDCGSVLAGE